MISTSLNISEKRLDSLCKPNHDPPLVFMRLREELIRVPSHTQSKNNPYSNHHNSPIFQISLYHPPFTFFPPLSKMSPIT